MTELHRQFVYMENEKILGAFVLNTDPQGAYENVAWSRNLRRGEYMAIHALAVDPECTGEGIGGKMVAFCVNYAKSKGYNPETVLLLQSW